MKKKRSFNWLWFLLALIFVVGVVGSLIYGGSHGWFKASVVNGTSTSTVNNNYLLNPDPVTPGNNNVAPIMNDSAEEDSTVPFFAWVGDLFVPKEETNIPIIIIPSSTCEDSDSQSAVNSYFIAGYVLTDGTGTNDICSSNTILKEYSCSDKKALVETSVDCSDYGRICAYSNGRAYCKIPVACSDTDDGDASMHQGTCTDELGSHFDSCGRGTSLTEYYCRNNMCATKTITCGYCAGGACQEALI